MSRTDYGQYVEFIEELADVSGNIIRHYYRQLDGFDTKQDASPVTQADMEVEKALRAAISKKFPQHGIVGEEFGNENETADYQWVIDPIDGTLSFMAGRPIFCTMVSLVHKNIPVIGLIDQPINRERWVGVKDEFVSLNGTMIRTSTTNILEQAKLATTNPYLFQPQEYDAFRRLSQASKYTIYGGDAYNYGLLAAGYVDMVMESGLKPHDFCALAVIIEAAGGKVTDFSGKALHLHSDGTILACSQKILHNLALKIIAPC